MPVPNPNAPPNLVAQMELWKNIVSYKYDDIPEKKTKADVKNPPPETATAHLDKFCKAVYGDKPNMDTLENLKGLHATFLASANNGPNKDNAQQAALIEWLYSRAAFQYIESQRGNFTFGFPGNLKHEKNFLLKTLKNMRAASKAKNFGETIPKTSLLKDNFYYYNPSNGEIFQPTDPNAGVWGRTKQTWGALLAIIDSAADCKTPEGKLGFFVARSFRKIFSLTLLAAPKWIYKKIFGGLGAFVHEEAEALHGLKAAKNSATSPFMGPGGSPIPNNALDVEKAKERQRQEEYAQADPASRRAMEESLKQQFYQTREDTAAKIEKSWLENLVLSKLVKPEEVASFKKHLDENGLSHIYKDTSKLTHAEKNTAREIAAQYTEATKRMANNRDPQQKEFLENLAKVEKFFPDSHRPQPVSPPPPQQGGQQQAGR